MAAPTLVHPHVRGDDEQVAETVSHSQASVHPHVRGDDNLHYCIFIFILRGGVPLVHPHVRGEDLGLPRCGTTSTAAHSVHPHGRGDDRIQYRPN